jgi:hypothetical protein
MKIRRALVLTAIPVLVGTMAFISPNQTNAANRSERIAQATDAPNSPPDGQHKPPRIDFAAAAAKLGVTEAQLKDALGVPANPPSPSDRNQRPPRPNFNDAAKKLGVTEQQLTDALGIPPHPPDGDRPANPPDGDRPTPPLNR